MTPSGAISCSFLAVARETPHNVRQFYNIVRAKDQCTNILATGFYSSSDGSNNFEYCGDYLHTHGIIYLQGRYGALVNMDVDCDGQGGTPADDGRCRVELSPGIQNATTFSDLIASYSRGIMDLNPYVHPYVVFGNAKGTRHRKGWREFDPSKYGMKPLSVMAAVCPADDKVVYGVWGDTNGDDDEKPMVGEASLALATMCGGKSINGNNGIDQDEVLYIGFVGDEAVPGPDGADWAAKDPDTFGKSIEQIGDRLVKKVTVDATSGAAGTGWCYCTCGDCGHMCAELQGLHIRLHFQTASQEFSLCLSTLNFKLSILHIEPLLGERNPHIYAVLLVFNRNLRSTASAGHR
ncbi:hypothetical protein VTJ49DRAFT_2066 [Mycothermus thermophilus]|uniref:Endo-chitosanase n=1 Tax=Humicola insolens TaxID=85995 RepID=A0ABR3VAS8_HUMIN